jgi:uncharacterized protein with GYD domain
MPKFLVVASYSPQGLEGVMRTGGTARRDAVDKAIVDLGGTMESFHFAFGEGDAYVIAELPDNVAAAALGIAVSSTGMASTRTVVLLTPEEIDRATRTEIHYQPPGS